MGAIYKVRHLLLDEIRIIKVIRSQYSDDVALQKRFRREARAAIRLRHPNIAQLYDFSVAESGEAFMVLEFIDGVTLREMLTASDLRRPNWLSRSPVRGYRHSAICITTPISTATSHPTMSCSQGASTAGPWSSSSTWVSSSIWRASRPISPVPACSSARFATPLRNNSLVARRTSGPAAICTRSAIDVRADDRCIPLRRREHA